MTQRIQKSIQKKEEKTCIAAAAQLRPVTGERGKSCSLKKLLITYCTERKEKQRESADSRETHELLHGQSWQRNSRRAEEERESKVEEETPADQTSGSSELGVFPCQAEMVRRVNAVSERRYFHLQLLSSNQIKHFVYASPQNQFIRPLYDLQWFKGSCCRDRELNSTRHCIIRTTKFIFRIDIFFFFFFKTRFYLPAVGFCTLFFRPSKKKKFLEENEKCPSRLSKISKSV